MFREMYTGDTFHGPRSIQVSICELCVLRYILRTHLVSSTPLSAYSMQIRQQDPCLTTRTPRPYGPVALWPCGPVALWPCGPVALWLCGPLGGDGEPSKRGGGGSGLQTLLPGTLCLYSLPCRRHLCVAGVKGLFGLTLLSYMRSHHADIVEKNLAGRGCTRVNGGSSRGRIFGSSRGSASINGRRKLHLSSLLFCLICMLLPTLSERTPAAVKEALKTEKLAKISVHVSSQANIRKKENADVAATQQAIAQQEISQYARATGAVSPAASFAQPLISTKDAPAVDNSQSVLDG